MRKLLAAIILCVAVCFGISGLKLMRGDPSGSAQFIALLIAGIAIAGAVFAGLLAFRQPSDDDYDDTILAGMPQGPRAIIEMLLMIGLGLVIATVTLKGVLSGAVRPMVTRGPFVHLREEPWRFLFETAAWLIAAWLVGWAAPRWVARKRDAGED